MKRLICFLIGHRWKILNKLKLSDIANKMNKEYWWIGKSFRVDNNKDFYVINRQCIRCNKFDNNIDEARKLVKFKILN